MQENVDQMVARRGIAPEFLFHPSDAENQRIILLGGAGLKPDPLQAVPGLQGRPYLMGRIVPNRFPVPRGLVGQEHRYKQTQCQEPVRRAAAWFFVPGFAEVDGGLTGCLHVLKKPEDTDHRKGRY